MRAYERLMQYAVIPTASDPASGRCPSSDCQWELLRLLERELKQLGAAAVQLDNNGYLFARIPSTVPDYHGYQLGFLAHVDVSPDAPSVGVRPRLVRFDGGGIPLGDSGLVLSEEEFPALRDCRGCRLVVTDGHTLLGADDKAGVAEIMTLAERLLRDPAIPHGEIMLAFTPDEEIGAGADRFDVQGFGADFAFTVDGGDWQEINCETFNAVAAEVEFYGVGAHPGEAKGRMVNAGLLALEFAALLPVGERPEYTEGYEGFFHLHSLEGHVEQARLSYLLRDHHRAALERRMGQMTAAAAFITAKYGEGRVRLEMKESYRNLAEALAPYPFLVDLAKEAIREAGGRPATRPVRGGTDGSRLSFMGLPCPNLGTGAANMHSRYEYACVEQMDAVVQVLQSICQKITALS